METTLTKIETRKSQMFFGKKFWELYVQIKSTLCNHIITLLRLISYRMMTHYLRKQHMCCLLHHLFPYAVQLDIRMNHSCCFSVKQKWNKKKEVIYKDWFGQRHQFFFCKFYLPCHITKILDSVSCPEKKTNNSTHACFL